MHRDSAALVCSWGSCKRPQCVACRDTPSRCRSGRTWGAFVPSSGAHSLGHHAHTAGTNVPGWPLRPHRRPRGRLLALARRAPATSPACWPRELRTPRPPTARSLAVGQPASLLVADAGLACLMTVPRLPPPHPPRCQGSPAQCGPGRGPPQTARAAPDQGPALLLGTEPARGLWAVTRPHTYHAGTC